MTRYVFSASSGTWLARQSPRTYRRDISVTRRRAGAAVASLLLLASVFAPAADVRPSEGPVQFDRRPHDPWRDREPPRLPAEEITSAPGHGSRGSVARVQVNVNAQGLNILGDAANEPTIAVDPTNPNRIVIGWRQFDSVASDFRQAGWAYTTNGGLSWTFPGKIEPGAFRSDPVVDVDANGVFYYNSLTNNPDFQCKVFRSYNGGATWDAGTFAWGGDKQWQVIDTTGGPGHGFIYMAWNPAFSTAGCNGMFTRSTNGGASFEPCTSIPLSPVWGTLAVGPDGELYVAGRSGFSTFYVAKSLNAQIAGQTPTWTTTNVNLGGSILFSAGPNPAGLLGQVWVDIDRSNGPRRGWVYVVGTIQPSSGGDPAEIIFVRSTNGGQTWSAPVRLNDDPAGANNWQWFGTMSVAPSGRIDVVWLDTRANPGTYLCELYYTYSEDGGTTWAPNEALTTAFDPTVGWPVQQKMGDYFDMVSFDDAAHLAFAATFNSEEDIYYTRITRLLKILLPDGVPSMLTPGQPFAIPVRVVPGSEAVPPDSLRFYYRYDGGAWASLPLTPLGGDLYQAVLPAPYCGATPQFYFQAFGSQSGFVFAPVGAPQAPYSARVGATQTFLTFNLDTNPGFTISGGQWEFGQPTGQGGGLYGFPDPTSGYTGSNVLGINLNGNYSTVPAGPFYVTSPALDLSGKTDVKLSFRRWLNVDRRPYVGVGVQASASGAQWANIWQNGTVEIKENAWSLQTYSLAAVVDGQPAARVRWSHHVGNGAFAYSGWNIDDVSLSAFVCDGPALCAGDLDCNGVVDFDDIDRFIEALGYAQGTGWPYAECPWFAADANADNLVNFNDIDAFVELIGTACP